MDGSPIFDPRSSILDPLSSILYLGKSGLLLQASRESRSVRFAHPEVGFQTLQGVLQGDVDVAPHGFGGRFRRAADQRVREVLVAARRFIGSGLAGNATPGRG